MSTRVRKRPRYVRMRMPWLLALHACLLVLLCAASAQAQPRDETLRSAAGTGKIALVLGNGAYEQAPLRNPGTDAQAMADSLTRLGFRVTLRTDVTLTQMTDAMEQFTREGRNDDVRLFFYAGHGVQYRGRNYLVPVDANIQTPEDIPESGVDVQQLIERLQRSSKGFNVVILDACRSYPLPTVKFRGGTRGIEPPPAQGLAQVTAPNGTLVAFSTSPGAVARDGNSGHSVYAKHLLANLETPGLTVEQLFKKIRIGVMRDTEQSQMPWENSSLTGEFCFKLGRRGQCPGL